MDLARDDDSPGVCWEENADTWTRQSRAGYDVYRDVLNTPAFLAMLPSVAGMRGLDVGCGEGTNTRAVARLGARMRGVDIAPTFIRHAKETEAAAPLGIGYQVADALSLPFDDGVFDFVVAFMSLMDVGGPERVLKEIFRVLRPGGFVQFSILHPCFAPPHRKVLRDSDGVAHAVEVAEYFAVGRHVETWQFSSTDEEERARTKPFRVPYVHLTLAGWFDAIRGAGLELRRLHEPCASEESAAKFPIVADTRIAPLFLHVLADKPEATGYEVMAEAASDESSPALPESVSLGTRVRVRPMSAADWDAVAAIYREGMDGNMATFQTTCPPYAEWDTAHLASCRLVVEAEGAVAGWAALSPVSGRCVYAGVAEVSVYVASSYQGAGVGTELLRALCRASEEEGFWTLQSGIMQENVASIRLHEKCGFRMVGYRERIAQDRYGMWRNTVLMERRKEL